MASKRQRVKCFKRLMWFSLIFAFNGLFLAKKNGINIPLSYISWLPNIQVSKRANGTILWWLLLWSSIQHNHRPIVFKQKVFLKYLRGFEVMSNYTTLWKIKLLKAMLRDVMGAKKFYFPLFSIIHYVMTLVTVL